MSCLADVVEVGGTGGKPGELKSTLNWATLKQICVWVGDNQVRKLKVWLTDDCSMEFGKLNGDVRSFTFEDGEHFTSLSLWTKLDRTRLGAIKFKTNHSREFFAQMKKERIENLSEVPVDVASGICIGIRVRSDEKIDSLGFMFLNTIKSSVLTSVVYPTIFDVIPKVNAREIKSMTYRNNTTKIQEYKIETSKKITQTSSWSVTGKLELTFSLEVKGGIPLLAEGTTGYRLNLGVEGTYASQTTEEKMEHFSFPVKVPPGKTMDMHITVGEAKIDLPFNGTVKITCLNGSELEFKTSGTYKGVAHTSGDVVVNESEKKIARASLALK